MPWCSPSFRIVYSARVLDFSDTISIVLRSPLIYSYEPLNSSLQLLPDKPYQVAIMKLFGVSEPQLIKVSDSAVQGLKLSWQLSVNIEPGAKPLNILEESQGVDRCDNLFVLFRGQRENLRVDPCQPSTSPCLFLLEVCAFFVVRRRCRLCFLMDLEFEKQSCWMSCGWMVLICSDDEHSCRFFSPWGCDFLWYSSISLGGEWEK